MGGEGAHYDRARTWKPKATPNENVVSRPPPAPV